MSALNLATNLTIELAAAVEYARHRVSALPPNRIEDAHLAFERAAEDLDRWLQNVPPDLSEKLVIARFDAVAK